MSALRIVPDTWTQEPAPLPPAVAMAVQEDARAIGEEFGIAQRVIYDAILTASIRFPSALCMVTGI